MIITYRFRIFIIIYPFIHIIAALGFLASYELLSNMKGKKYIAKTVFTFIILIVTFHGISVSIKAENKNKTNFIELSSKINNYLQNLSNNKKREISYYQGDISTWFYYYFAKRRTQNLYPYLSNSIIWDWKKERPNTPYYGDLFIAIDGKCPSYRFSQEKFDKIINNRKPIIKVPFNQVSRCDNYSQTTLNRRIVSIEVYDLKTEVK